MRKKRKTKQRKERARRGYTVADLAQVWDGWKRGESLKAIGRVFGKEGSPVYGQLAPYGGIRPRTRCRSKRALTLVEREEISRGIAARRTMRSIARTLCRAPSTVSRELSRNGGYDRYRASAADEASWERTCRPKQCRLVGNRKLLELVDDKLRASVGHRSRLRVGSSEPIREMSPFTCPTKRSIAAFSSRPAGL